jgi:hypothetical protein
VDLSAGFGRAALRCAPHSTNWLSRSKFEITERGTPPDSEARGLIYVKIKLISMIHSPSQKGGGAWMYTLDAPNPPVFPNNSEVMIFPMEQYNGKNT